MTRRERMERRMERRERWAGSAAAESSRRFDTARTLGSQIPLGQPILVGHHSEKRHRGQIERIDSNMGKAVEAHRRAQDHESKAAGIADQLDRSVFSDDADAIEQLRARIAKRTAQADLYTKVNKAWRKYKGDVAAMVAAGVMDEKLAQTIAATMRVAPYLRKPLDTTNVRASIRRDEERIIEVEARQRRAEEAGSAGGVAILPRGEFVVVTFAEKPDREILDALRTAGFRWGAGSWVGRADVLPSCVSDLVVSDLDN